jgi:hypothetical protein
MKLLPSDTSKAGISAYNLRVVVQNFFSVTTTVEIFIRRDIVSAFTSGKCSRKYITKLGTHYLVVVEAPDGKEW